MKHHIIPTAAALLGALAAAPALHAAPTLPQAKTAVQTEAQAEAQAQQATAAHVQQLSQAQVEAEARHVSWSLDSCINYATAHNLDVRSARLALMGGSLDVTEARDRFLPTLSAAAGQSWAFGRGLTSQNTYANRNTGNFNWNASLQLPLFQGLAALRSLRRAQGRARTLDLQLAAARDEVTLQVIGLYLQALYNREMLNVCREELRLNETQLRLQEGLLEAGKVPEADVLQARSQVATAQVSVVDADADMRLAFVDLIRALELQHPEGFDIQEVDFADGLPGIPTYEEVFARAMGCNNSLQAARSAVADADRDISVARTGYLPTLSLQAGIGAAYYTVAGEPHMPFHRQMKENLSKSIGFTLNLPLFDAFATRNSVRRARLQKLQAQLEVDRRESELTKSIRQAHSQATGAQAQYHAGVLAVEASKAALQAMTDKYTYGRANATEWQQAHTDYIKTLAKQLQAKYELILRCRILRFYME